MKSLKFWFEQVNKEKLNESEQLTIEPAKQSTQIIKQGNKTLGTVSNPALAANIKAAIGKGEMSLAGKDIKEEIIDEKAPPGMEKWIKDRKAGFKKQYGDRWEEVLYATAWKMKDKQKKEAAEDNPESAMLEADVEESGLQAYLGKKKYGKEGMAALQKAGREGASKEKMAQIRAKHDKMDEAEIPHSGPDYGAGLGAGRNDKVLEAKPDFLDLDKDGNKKEPMKKAAADKKKQKVKESMNTLEAAYHEGKSHGLSKSNYACRYNEGSEEHKRYHDGFKEGLDECYGLMPNRGLVVSEVESEADVVDNMASYGAEEGALGEMDKTAYMQHKAKTTPGDTFKAFGQTFKDKDVEEAYAFESLNKQLEQLLKEDSLPVSEGLSVSMSTGQQGSPDSVSVTGTDDEAAKLLSFIKQVGLGGMGGDAVQAEPAPAVAVVSDYGAPKFSGHDDMKALLGKVSGGDDFKDEEGHSHKEGKMCETHGVVEGQCGCGESKEQVMGEVETPDQLEANVAEDDGEGNIEADEQGAQIDAALAVGSENEKEVTEGGDGGESSPEAAGAVAAADAAEEEEEAMSESSLFKKLLSVLAEESKSEEDDKAEKAGEKVKKEIEYDDKKDAKEKKLDEWANDAGKDGTETTFERDIEFMTKVIAGGLNKPKSTGQQTIPVLAGDKERTGEEDIAEWRRLAGLG